MMDLRDMHTVSPKALRQLQVVRDDKLHAPRPADRKQRSRQLFATAVIAMTHNDGGPGRQGIRRLGPWNGEPVISHQQQMRQMISARSDVELQRITCKFAALFRYGSNSHVYTNTSRVDCRKP